MNVRDSFKSWWASVSSDPVLPHPAILSAYLAAFRAARDEAVRCCEASAARHDARASMFMSAWSNGPDGDVAMMEANRDLCAKQEATELATAIRAHAGEA